MQTKHQNKVKAQPENKTQEGRRFELSSFSSQQQTTKYQVNTLIMKQILIWKRFDKEVCLQRHERHEVEWNQGADDETQIHRSMDDAK